MKSQAMPVKERAKRSYLEQRACQTVRNNVRNISCGAQRRLNKQLRRVAPNRFPSFPLARQDRECFTGASFTFGASRQDRATHC
jgi:hypothetical protein